MQKNTATSPWTVSRYLENPSLSPQSAALQSACPQPVCLIPTSGTAIMKGRCFTQ